MEEERRRRRRKTKKKERKQLNSIHQAVWCALAAIKIVDSHAQPF